LLNQIQIFDLIANLLEEKTKYNSFIDVDNVYYKVILNWAIKNPEILIPLILNRVNRSWSWIEILHDIVDKKELPYILDEYTGDFYSVCQAWIDWGKDKGYL
jgi:hypothetical protein